MGGLVFFRECLRIIGQLRDQRIEERLNSIAFLFLFLIVLTCFEQRSG
jgi:hypothetical protein